MVIAPKPQLEPIHDVVALALVDYPRSADLIPDIYCLSHQAEHHVFLDFDQIMRNGRNEGSEFTHYPSCRSAFCGRFVHKKKSEHVAATTLTPLMIFRDYVQVHVAYRGLDGKNQVDRATKI